MTDPPCHELARLDRQSIPVAGAALSICWPVSPKVVDIRHCGTAGFPAVFANIGRSIAFPPCSIVDLKTPALPPGFSV